MTQHAYGNDNTHRAHCRFGKAATWRRLRDPTARYAKGEITRDEYAQMKFEISSK